MTPPIDETAVADLYQRYGHALYRRCLTLVHSEADAHELLQEVFCQFWRRREKFAGRSSAFTYLYRIATNLSIDRLRRRHTAGPQVALDETRRPAGEGANAEKRVAAARDLATLTAGLDDDSVTVAVLSYVDGLTQEEIAAAVGVSRRTVGKRLKKFLNHTRKQAARQEQIAAVKVGS